MNDSANVEVSIAAEGQLLLCSYLFQYLQMSDLWITFYTVHPIFARQLAVL
jgi:hypothetical protein